ncbi:hypothetical protein RclHR1_02630012 [Rhizophagus clarus]|uniref:WAP domain-containing protein n=1 Tax=Rhizophagus clarus TaxID=94130 RepID=A0A2Z6R0F7_9GLOM|nr:hypothetical protein RclHR1_02630012 [Rhizophagus clarus]GES80922.1 hypothetical protein GLOIN_2v1704946 [Rhizophagus clarus]
MKNLILILVLAVVTFSTIATATPTYWKRGGAFKLASILNGKSSSVSLMERQLECPLGDDPCPNGVVCCPSGAACLQNNLCDVPCPDPSNFCGDGCCNSNEVCSTAPNGQPVCVLYY